MSVPASPGAGPTCASCGSTVDPAAEFCTACGTAQRTRRVGHRALLAALAAVVAGLVVVIGMVLSDGDDGGGDDGPVVIAEPVETSAPATTAVPDTPAPTNPPTTAPVTTEPPVAPGEPGVFASPEEAIADHLSKVDLPYAGTCESLSGQEADLGGSVMCSILVDDLRPQQIHRWGVFATDDLRGWLFLDVGSAGWSVVDESFEARPPDSWPTGAT